jgi:GntR family carbon starvation induced transcriptional regulator
MAWDTVATAEVGLNAKSAISRVVSQLREDLISVVIEPGAKLRIASLAQKYEANPGAVREALSRLVSEGLVVAEDQKGFRASPVSATFLTDIMSTRVFVEVEALRRSIAFGDTDWEANVLAATHRLSKVQQLDPETGAITAKWRNLHRLYHHALIADCGSPTLLQLQSQLFSQTERYRCLQGSLSQNGKIRDGDNEHHQIAELVVARDFESASKALERHYNKTVQLLLASGRLQ